MIEMRALYDSKSKDLDNRGIYALLSENTKYETWIQVELALAKAEAKVGMIPQSAADEICERGTFENIDFQEVNRIKEEVGHGFVPFLKVFTMACGKEGSKYVHYGATTQNIQQTSQLYIAKKVWYVFYGFIKDILVNLADLAEKHADTVMPGRTHGRHAIPITYGFKLSSYIDELISTVERMKEAESRIFTVMMGGAVGSFNTMGEVGPMIQDLVADELEMSSMTVPSRSISSHKLEMVMILSLLCNVLHKMGEEVYYTGIEEFNEIQEPFKKGTIGSSTMPHKINPKLSKGIIANSQKLYTLVSLGLNTGTRMFEGDSSSYMVHEAMIEEALELCTEVLMRAEELTRGLIVNKESMAHNAQLNGGLDNTENIMMKMADRLGKDVAHSLLYEKAMLVEREGREFIDVLREDPAIRVTFSDKELEEMLLPENYIGIGADIARKVSAKARETADSL